MLNVDRASPQQKIVGLLKAVPELVDEMEAAFTMIANSRETNLFKRLTS